MEEEILRIFNEVNRDAALEMSYKPRSSYIVRCKELSVEPLKTFYDPKLRSLHPWIARRPRSASRLSILLAFNNIISPSEVVSLFDVNELRTLPSKGYPPLMSFMNPKQLGLDAVLCDPMAGGGSIPLESTLLGLKTIAFDYNPVAYLILKGAIDYPLKFKEKLGEMVEEEARKLIKYAQNILGNFYGIGDDAYIFTKHVTCPTCGRRLSLSPVDFSFLGDLAVIVKKEKGTIKVLCSRCGVKFMVDERKLLSEWGKRHVELLSALLSGGEVSPEHLLDVHPILALKKDDGSYQPAERKDEKLFIRACSALAGHSSELKEFLPLDEIPLMNDVFCPITSCGLKLWHHIFNPRQLLALGFLTRYVAERGEELILREGELGAAITLT